MLMPVDYLDQYFPVASKIVSTGKAKGLDEVKDLLKDMITDYLDKKTPDTAETVAGKLIDEQIAWLDRSLREHGLPAMTTSQQALMRDAMEGRVQGALLDALKRRGG